jgi:hypothetical protein
VANSRLARPVYLNWHSKLIEVLHACNRRGFLHAIAGGAVGIAACRRVSAQTGSAQANAPLEVKKFTDSFLLITGAGGNVLAVIGAEGVLLVNGGSPERSEELLKLVADHSDGKQVKEACPSTNV